MTKATYLCFTRATNLSKAAHSKLKLTEIERIKRLYFAVNAPKQYCTVPFVLSLQSILRNNVLLLQPQSQFLLYYHDILVGVQSIRV